MEFNFDSNLKKEILQEALSRLEIELYRAIVLSPNDYDPEEFDHSSFVPDPERPEDSIIVGISDRINVINKKIEELES
jgi:hypothetical protein